MTGLGIKIQTWEEGQRKENGLSFEKTDKYKRAYIKEACIMERGTASGGTSVAFMIVDEDGNKFFAELTGNLVEGLNAALQGANMRFKGL